MSCAPSLMRWKEAAEKQQPKRSQTRSCARCAQSPELRTNARSASRSTAMRDALTLCWKSGVMIEPGKRNCLGKPCCRNSNVRCCGYPVGYLTHNLHEFLVAYKLAFGNGSLFHCGQEGRPLL